MILPPPPPSQVWGPNHDSIVHPRTDFVKGEISRGTVLAALPATHILLCRFKEAVNECTNALEIDAVYAKALIRRAKAHEAMGHYKQALSDIQKANKADSANPDTQVGFL